MDGQRVVSVRTKQLESSELGMSLSCADMVADLFGKQGKRKRCSACIMRLSLPTRRTRTVQSVNGPNHTTPFWVIIVIHITGPNGDFAAPGLRDTHSLAL